MMRVYTLERTEEKAVLCNRGTASEFSAGLRKTNFRWDFSCYNDEGIYTGKN